MKEVMKLVCLIAITVLTSISAQVNAQEAIVFYHNDLLGSPVAATDQYGNLCWREDYTPYGQKRHDGDTGCGLDDNEIGYTGHVHDEDIGLTYAQARYYDPVIGRFYGMDPIGPRLNEQVSFNRYAYGNNNPYKFKDPDGMEPDDHVGGDFGDSLGPGRDAHSSRAELARQHWMGTEDGRRYKENFNFALGLAIPAVGSIKAFSYALKAANKARKLNKVTDKNPEITAPYKRPSNATTKAQRKSVQDKPCVDCGDKISKKYADHKEPLVKEHYRTGNIDKSRMRSIDSVQPQCAACSSRQGAELSRFSRQMKREHGFE